MLSARAAQTVAFHIDGTEICAPCARQAYGEVRVARAEAGLEAGDLHSVSRYELETSLAEAAYDLDGEIVNEFEAHCDACGAVL